MRTPAGRLVWEGLRLSTNASSIVENNKIRPEDRCVHDWYRFVLSYPPHLVDDYLTAFGMVPGNRVLDPFCGTGTTLVECKKAGIASVGIEANPMAYVASATKVDWDLDPDALVMHADEIAQAALGRFKAKGITDSPDEPHANGKRRALLTLPPETMRLLLKDSISPLPLHKTLVLLDVMNERRSERLDSHERLAMAKALVSSIGNLHFGPEVGVGKPKPDAAVVSPWLRNVQQVADDIRELRDKGEAQSHVHFADSRQFGDLLEPASIDAVITSPPYPNEKDYTRTTRLESVVLGLVSDRKALRKLKQGLLRSNTRNVYKGDSDDELVADNAEIQRIAVDIENRRIELGKTSGFERMYARVTKLYFGGMARHLSDLRPLLSPGAKLAYVVGDQASYLRVMIRTGQILAGIAESLGYEVAGIDLFRTRMATATREQLREEVVLLRWPG